MNKNIFKYDLTLSHRDRVKIKNHKPLCIWFTGLSGSGKSTISNALEVRLNKKKINTYILDGDNLRAGICSNLGFENKDRDENVRRAAEISKLFFDAGIVVICSLISPFQKQRDFVRSLFPSHSYFEIYLSTPINECESRDNKGLYKKARNGLIQNFTGINSPYEAPLTANLTIDTKDKSVEKCVDIILEKLKDELF